MRVFYPLLATAVIFFVTNFNAQNYPNFSGKWTLITDRSEPNGRGAFGETFTAAQALPNTKFLSPERGQLNCPRISKDLRPALLFVDGTQDESHLWVAYEYAGELRRESIISAKYLEVTQLDNAAILITASETPQIGSIYAMDLESGTIKRISEIPNMRCLRAEPSRKKAMLIDSSGITGEDRFVELGLVSFATADRQILSKNLLGDEYDRMGHPFKISPDFTHIAYVSKNNATGVERRSDFELKILDLRTFKTEILDNSVRVEIPSISSFSNGIPPFEWISNSQVLYQHMVSQDETGKEGGRNFLRLDGLCAFKIADIRTGDISVGFTKELRMELNGGSLETDPLTGQLILNRKYILNYIKNQLTDRIFPFDVSADRTGKKTEIRSSATVLYSGDAMCLGTCLSPSGSYFAYVLRPAGSSLAAELYAVFNGDLKPLKVAVGTSSPTHAIGWIE